MPADAPTPTPAPKTIQWTEGSVWMSVPPGAAIISTADQVTVESGGRMLLAVKMHRPEALVLLDEVHLFVPGPQGVTQSKMTLQRADGPLAIGEPLLAAWGDHVARFRKAQGRAQLVGVRP